MEHYPNNDLGNKQPLGNYASSSHTHDDIYYRYDKVNELLYNIKYTYATIDNNFVKSGSVLWAQIGKIVIVYIIDMVLYQGINTDNYAIIAYNMPKPSYDIVAQVYAYYDNSTSTCFRIMVDSYQQLKPWYFGLPTSSEVILHGSFCYFSESA